MAYVQMLYDGLGAGSKTFSPTANAPVGDLLVACVSYGSSQYLTSISDTQSNTWTVHTTSGGLRTMALASTIVSTEITTSDTITLSATGSANPGVVLLEYSGIQTSPYDTGNNNFINGGTSLSTNSTGTLAQANELVVAAMAGNGAFDTLTPPGSPWTQISPSAANIIDIAYQEVSSTSSLSASWSWTPSRNVGAAIGTFKLVDAPTFIPRITIY